MPLRPPAVRAHRRTEVAAEVRGLRERLERIPGDCVVLVVGGAGGVANRTAAWADAAERQTVVIPAVGDRVAAATDLAVDLTLAAAEAGAQVATFVCALADDDPTLAAFAGRGLPVWPVLPAEPEPALEPGAEDKPKGRQRTAKAQDETPAEAVVDGAKP